MNEQATDESTEVFSLRQMDQTDGIPWINLLLEVSGKNYLESKLKHRKWNDGYNDSYHVK